jgi:hypothetical protein
MADIRIQVAYHFKIDPAKLLPGAVRLPEQITRTVSVGEEFTTEKVSTESLSLSDRLHLETEIEKQVAEATRTARPAGAPVVPAAAAQEEESAF